MSISNNIKQLRESRNMTQSKFGKIAGVSDKAVSTWENGTAEPRMGAIQRIADYFGVTKGWIIEGEPSSSSAADQADDLFIEKYGQPIYDAAMTFASLDDIDRGRISERMSMLLEDPKYAQGEGYGEKVI